MSFGKSERVAIGAVLLLIVLFVLLPAVFRRFSPVRPTDYSGFSKEIADFLEKQEAVEPAATVKDFDFHDPDREIVRKSIKPFEFDPNNLNTEGWIRMGFSEKQAASIVRFREKGGTFRKKEDVRRLYAVTDEVYQILEPYIRITSTGKPENAVWDSSANPRSHALAVREKYRVELNSADSAELVRAYGIGPATARRILRYRERLGGYVSASQLLEIPGIDSARYETFRDEVFADPETVRKINVNTASITELRQHPYIDYFIAKAIVDKRIRSGGFKSPDELAGIPLLYEALFNKLKPYLSAD